ncbi:acyl-CoA dehydrogenase family protein [Streptomyces sp. NPDC058401]|uniref:acyl-CoA dehydrogenase family protein n=1 Tax=Streptomyces sp. NPDC058401 TaxID=3346480 RepID=UPI00364C49E3
MSALSALLRERVDPEAVERSGKLPGGLMDDLREGGFLQLLAGRDTGGLGLSPYHAFRVIEAAASWCTPVAFSLAITNGFGSGSYLPLLPEGPLKDMIAERSARGIVSAGADAETIGTANHRRATRAVPVDGGAFYEITGEKVFIGNGPVADLMDVSATLRGPDGKDEVRLFFVDSTAPGFRVAARHEFMGLRGAEIGALHLDRVKVPAFHLMDESEDGWRMRPGDRTSPSGERAPGDGAGPGGRVEEQEEEAFHPADFGQLAALGRILVIAPSSLAITKLCLQWSREFVGRRNVDGKGLGEYDEIQRHVAETAAEVFTADTVLTWALNSHLTGDNQPELTAAKNLVSMACWRTVDRTVSLLGAEGYETAASKAGRGAQPLPVERFFRDARALRVAGGVDFMVDRWAAEAALTSCHFTAETLPPAGGDPHTGAGAGAGGDDDGFGASPACREHWLFLLGHAKRFARTCTELTYGTTPEALFRRQRTVAVVGRIGGELLSMSLVLARAASLAAGGDPRYLPLADLSCAASRHRLSGLWHQLDEPIDGPRYEATAQAWLNGTTLDFLLEDVITDVPRPRP